jgi:hypothetical protein
VRWTYDYITGENIVINGGLTSWIAEHRHEFKLGDAFAATK